MDNSPLNTILGLDDTFQLCPKCGVVEPCLVHQPLPEGDVIQYMSPVDGGCATTVTIQNPVNAIPVVANSNPSPTNSEDMEDMEKDFEDAQSKIRAMLELAKGATEKALELAESGDSHQAYQVVGTLITATVNAGKELVNIHKSKKDIKDSPSKSGGTTINNIDKAVFVGRASDLIRAVTEARKKELLPIPEEV